VPAIVIAIIGFGAVATVEATNMILARANGGYPPLKQAEEVREHFLREFHIANIIKHATKLLQPRCFGWRVTPFALYLLPARARGYARGW